MNHNLINIKCEINLKDIKLILSLKEYNTYYSCVSYTYISFACGGVAIRSISQVRGRGSIKLSSYMDWESRVLSY